MKRGYRPALRELETAKTIVEDMEVLRGFQTEILEKINQLPDRRVAAAELMRDFGLSKASLKLFERTGWLRPTRERGARATYDLKPVLRLMVTLPGLTSITGIRQRRKHSNIVSIVRDVVSRLIGDSRPPRSRRWPRRLTENTCA